MALPKLNASTIYTLTIPSTGKKVNYRPFLVKEQKALLVAQESSDVDVMVNTLKGVISECVSDVDVDTLAVFDIQYIFNHLRSKSTGEMVELIFECDEDHGEKQKDAKVVYQLDITKAEVKTSPDHTKKIDLFDGVGVMMKYPTIQILKKLETLKNISDFYELIPECIDYIYDTQEVYYIKDQTKEEVTEFINNLTDSQFKKVEQFFSTMPQIIHKVEYRCPVCGKSHKRELGGLQNFF